LVEAVSYASATLDHLIGDLISLSRDGVAARLDRPPTRFNLGAAIRAVASTFIAEAATKGLRVEVETGDGVDLEILADVGSLGQILSSLLSNAVKFTEVGEVRISARGGDEGRYVFEVADTGVGFDAETYARILETFGQIDDSDVREHGGAGLGLAIARRLVGEFGGELAATSEPGVGSVFRFEIPLRAAEHEAQVDEPMTAPVDKAARVLIVDDNEMNRRVLQTILETAGLEYLSVADGRQAVEAASAEAFATILMDIQMPVMDGLTATREIRRLETTLGRPTCPVIMVSASCQPEYVAAGIAAGAQRHLAKPVNVRTLLGALSEVLAEEPVAA
jgi:CheY-like chemotaxis protein/two-component sensor histidine kinase